MAQPQNPHPPSPARDPERKPNGGAGDGLDALRRDITAWREGPVAKAQARIPQRHPEMTTWSGLTVPDLVTPAEKSVDYRDDLGLPGEYPFTRGVQPTMYRSRLWTMRMFAGFGTPEQTNERFKYLVSEGQSGLSTAFDFPTLMGYDSDSPRSLGEVGMCGVAVDTLRDMEVLFDGLPLESITTSMTINQLRGRSFRLDPNAPGKLANNWDVVCIAPEFKKGLDDYHRFRKKHKHLFGVTDDGCIEKGVGHVHAAFTEIKPEGVEKNMVDLNRDMLERVGQRPHFRRSEAGEPTQQRQRQGEDAFRCGLLTR